MRIYCAVRHSSDPNKFYGSLWSDNFYPALKRLGHEVIESQVDLLPASKFMSIPGDFTPQELECRAKITQQILDEVKTAHQQAPIDLFLCYFYNSHFDPAGYDTLQKLGMTCVNFYCNSVYQFAQVAEQAKAVQWSWHAEQPAEQLYREVGAQPVWVQMAADPEVYRPMESHAQRKRSASFVGQRYADRALLLGALAQAGIPLDIYGNNWGAPPPTSENGTPKHSTPQEPEPREYLGRKRMVPGSHSARLSVLMGHLKTQGLIGGTARVIRHYQHLREVKRVLPLLVPYARGHAKGLEGLRKVYAEHEVVLNFANVWADCHPGSTLIPHVRLRDFEAPMCRACYLTGHTDEIEHFYEVGEQIDTYRTPDELVDKTRFYLDHPEAAEKLRQKGFERARRDHTWEQRFKELFGKIGLADTATA